MKFMLCMVSVMFLVCLFATTVFAEETDDMLPEEGGMELVKLSNVRSRRGVAYGGCCVRCRRGCWCCYA